MAEIFNAEEAKSAIKSATSQIETVCADFKKLTEQVNANFGASGAALAGTAGKLAEQSFEVKSDAAFANLNSNLQSYMNRVDTIVAANQEATSTVSSVYGG